MFRSTLILAAAAVIAASSSAASVFNLHANAEVWNVNNGTSFLSDPKSTSFVAPGSGSVSSAVAMSGISAYQNISANLVDDYHGSITYSSGWDSVGLATAQVRLWDSNSTYAFSTTGTSTVKINWRCATTSSGSNTNAFGAFAVHAYIDGVIYKGPDQWPPQTSGLWTATLPAGAHTITFWDQGNLWGGFGTQSVTMTDTLDFSVQAVPEPATITAFLAAVPFLRRRKKA